MLLVFPVNPSSLTMDRSKKVFFVKLRKDLKISYNQAIDLNLPPELHIYDLGKIA